MMRKQVLDDARVFDELVMDFSIFGANLTQTLKNDFL